MEDYEPPLCRECAQAEKQSATLAKIKADLEARRVNALALGEMPEQYVIRQMEWARRRGAGVTLMKETGDMGKLLVEDIDEALSPLTLAPKDWKP